MFFHVYREPDMEVDSLSKYGLHTESMLWTMLASKDNLTQDFSNNFLKLIFFVGYIYISYQCKTVSAEHWGVEYNAQTTINN